ncbi:BamA/TamA family outer membrane protein [Lutibacter sp.]|uniref:translocation and assembly module lipoprotein TamL n=1 Tax=Lutibacter sp. TaxID=1925666 RepID=UPI0025BC992D|nr:BamA/TamA family outer membrane protein [Lutibacter sp.]MCF6180694.1 outer membrane protein assembly factor [Lutibacter sp.]
MKNNFIILIILVSITFSFSSCNAVKYVPENEHLLIKNNIIVNDKKTFDNEISDYIIQRPNQLVLGAPFPLYFYNIGNKNFETNFETWKKNHPGWYKFTKGVFSEKQARGVRDFKFKMHQWWLKNGEAPVILNPKKTKESVENLKLHYFQEGFFNAKVTTKNTFIKNKKTIVQYIIETGKPYVLDSLSSSIESTVLDSIYKTHSSETLIKKGEQFKFSTFIDEQNRISKLFRNSGIYRFNKNAILMDVDSSNYKANINLIINDSIADVPFKIQKIKTVNIYTDYSFNNKDKVLKDSVNYNGYHFLAQAKLNYNPKILLNSIFIEPNTIYKDESRELTRKHLRNLNNFKSVNIKYTELPNSDDLLASIYLTPLKKYALGFNTELNHSNIRQLGISGKLSFLNRNIFKGAEILKFSIQGSFLDSKDAASNNSLLNAWEIGGDVSLILPRFLLPFKTNKLVPKKMSPKTTFTLGTSLQKNIGLDKQKFTGIIDYTWNPSKSIHQSLQLLNAQFIKNLNIKSYFNIYTSEFNQIKDIATTYFNETITTNNVIDFINTNINTSFEATNPDEFKIAQNIKKRYNIITEDVLVPAITYTFTFNNSKNYKDIDFSFFRARIVSSGNLSTLLSKTRDNNNVKTILKTPIAQYLRTDFEYKKFWNIQQENVLAFRSFLGIAYPYGNSTSIPFSRSYFIGGPNDLRAWKIYDLGPGSTKTGLEYNVGSLKFLTSLEYRFKIINSIKGALFIDSGNIWDITNSSVTLESAKFKGISSLKDIAVGSGFGIRYDLSFILLRLDLGFKTYEPYLNKGNRWFKNYNFNHTVYNFGISYPF